jgi:hypothetical protein
VGEEGVRQVVDEHNAQNGPHDQFVLFRCEYIFPSRLDGRLLLMTSRAKEQFERFVVSKNEWFVQLLGHLATRIALERLLTGTGIEPQDLN